MAPLTTRVASLPTWLHGDELRHPLDTPVDLADSHAEVVDGISGLHAHPVVRTDDLPVRSTD